jgi:hypothetical protein
VQAGLFDLLDGIFELEDQLLGLEYLGVQLSGFESMVAAGKYAVWYFLESHLVALAIHVANPLLPARLGRR